MKVLVVFMQKRKTVGSYRFSVKGERTNAIMKWNAIAVFLHK